MATVGSSFPPPALDWLKAPTAHRVLAVGVSSLALATRLLTPGGRVTLVERNLEQLAAAAARQPGLTAISAVPEALPFVPCLFDQVVVAEGLHTMAPRLTLAEFARVLRPGGGLAVVHTARDDSVPWVRRLAGILRRADPNAMSDAGIAPTEAALHDSSYFPSMQRANFRRWVPASKPDLLAMVERSDGIAAADSDLRDSVIADVAALYEASATRPPEPLLLPYTVNCWRGIVDHTDLTAPLQAPDAGLRITL